MKASLALLALVETCLFGRLYAAPVLSCEGEPGAQEIARYQHTHEVSVRRPVRGPDGIELEVSQMISVTDELMVWDRGADTICVSLTAYDSSARECSVDGTAKKDAAGEFLFSEGTCAIHLSIGPNRIDLRVPKNGCQKGYCATDGAIEDATYVCE